MALKNWQEKWTAIYGERLVKQVRKNSKKKQKENSLEEFRIMKSRPGSAGRNARLLGEAGLEVRKKRNLSAHG